MNQMCELLVYIRNFSYSRSIISLYVCLVLKIIIYYILRTILTLQLITKFKIILNKKKM